MTPKAKRMEEEADDFSRFSAVAIAFAVVTFAAGFLLGAIIY